MRFWRKLKYEYLNIPSNIRNGMLVLSVLLFISILVIPVYKMFFKDQLEPLSQSEIALLDSIYEASINQVHEQHEITYFEFDPNKIDSITWTKLGVTKNVTARILKYIQKGGCFRKHEDLLKIYGFDTSTFRSLEPYIVIELQEKTVHFLKQPTTKFKTFPKKVTSNNNIVDINSADTSELISLPGIGVFYANRILKYRNLLGGFYAVKQLEEVYGFKSELIDKIKDKVQVDTSKIIKLDLHVLSIQQLSKHPYIGKNKAALICKLRAIEPGFENNHLVINNIFTNQEFARIQPYLK